MNSFVTITPEGRFALDGARWFCNSTIYYGHFPGAMRNWFSDDVWPQNQLRLEHDFARMAQIGLNHAALFLENAMFFDAGKLVQQGFDRLDEVVETARKQGIRLSLFNGQFLDNEAEYSRVTGRKWEHDNKWLPSFNPALFEAYVQQMKPLAERYASNSTVLGFGDRIDRFHKGFDNVTIPFNLKEEWADHLRTRYGTFESLREAVGGTFENDARDWNEVLLPQESKLNASLQNPLAYDYILWQKKTIGDTQAQWDAAMETIAPHQVFWTPFEGNTNTWAMIDGFSPETKKLRAIWMEWYYFEVTRAAPVQPFEEWAHTPEVIHRRLSHELPVTYNAVYMMTRYLKKSVQQPVVICHGVQLNYRTMGAETETHQVALMDRANAACLAGDGDGWHYWNWTDDWQSSQSHARQQKANPTDYYWQGESMGLHDWDDHPRPIVSLVCQYSSELKRRARKNAPVKQSEVLLLSSAPRNYNLFRRLAYATAAAVSGALTRVGVEADYLWTAQNEIPISEETLNEYKLIVIADNMYERDFREMPEKLLRYVEQGGTLYLPLDKPDSLNDEYGRNHASPAMKQLSGKGEFTDWPGASTPCRNWPFPTEAAHEPNMDVQAFPRLSWGVCPNFRHRLPIAYHTQLLGFRSTDGDNFSLVPGLVEGAEVIAVAKFPAGTLPFYYRHDIGKGRVFVNAWTNNIFRDSGDRVDYGGWEYDWMLALAVEAAEVQDADITAGAAFWLRNTWGYFWKEM